MNNEHPARPWSAYFSNITSFFFLFLLLSQVSPADISAFAAEPRSDDQPMNFIVVRSTVCQPDCLEWISAEGRITTDTPARLKKFLKRTENHRLPLVIQSLGGDVEAALQMGRMIRKAGLETAIGGTRLKDCPLADPRCKSGIVKKGPSSGQSYSGGAYCLSACPFMLAGGTSRLASQWATLGVHQITTVRQNTLVTYEIRYKMVRGKKKEVSRKEVRRKRGKETTTTKLTKKFVAKLKSYFKEMGVDVAIMDFVESAQPDQMRVLSPVEALKLGLMTDMFASNEVPGMVLCNPENEPTARCHRGQRQIGTTPKGPPSATGTTTIPSADPVQ